LTGAGHISSTQKTGIASGAKSERIRSSDRWTYIRRSLVKLSQFLPRLVIICILFTVVSNQSFAQKDLDTILRQGQIERGGIWVLKKPDGGQIVWVTIRYVFRAVSQGLTGEASGQAREGGGNVILDSGAKEIKFILENLGISYSSIISLLYESRQPRYASEFKAKAYDRFLTIRYKQSDESERLVILFLHKDNYQRFISALETHTGKKTEGMS
jgi:hypothetical protein